MKTRLLLRPGQNGTKKLVTRFGDRLVAVRYRYDEEKRKRLETVELIVDEAPWEPPAPATSGATAASTTTSSACGWSGTSGTSASA